MNKRLRIGILVDQLVPGGVQKSAIEEAKSLKSFGHNVTLFVLVRYKYKYQYRDLSRGLKVIFLSDYNPWPFKKAFLIPYFAFLTHLHILNPFFVHRYKALKKVDFIISHGTTTCITAAAISKKLHIPYMAFIWDPMLFIWEKVYASKPVGFFSPVIKRLIYSYEQSFLTSAGIVATSSKVHQEFIKNVYHVNPFIIHPASIPPKKIPPKKDSFILGYTRWELKKNPQLFLWLAKKLPTAKFLLAGAWTNSKEERIFKALIKKQKLGEKVKLISPVKHPKLKDIAAQSIMWVHPNFEAFGIAGLEMASLGLPIIAPKGSGVTELFEHGKHGYFPKQEKKEEFLNYLRLLLANRKKTLRMGKAAAEIAKSYTWKRHTKLVLDSIQEYASKTKILVIETGHALGTSLAGGDKLMEPMAMRLSDQYAFSIIVPQIGSKHWLEAPLQKELTILSKNPFDSGSKPTDIFITYCIRMWQTYKILKSKVSVLLLSSIAKKSVMLYSSTNILPDVLPTFATKLAHGEIRWIARVHHLIPPPYKREGRIIVNVVSFLMQTLALFMIKSKADIIIVLNEQLKKDLEKKGFLREKLRVLGGGIEYEKIINLISKDKIKFQAVFLGRLHTTKGVFDTIPIWKKVTNQIPTAKLAIIGDGPEEIKKQLEEKIKDAGLSSNIRILGFLPYEELYGIMRKANLFLFLDHEAGWGLAVAEAMAMGLPVVGYDNGVLGSVYKTGFRKVPLSDYQRFSSEVLILMRDRNLRRKLATQARREAKKHDWGTTSKNFNLILQEVFNTI